MGIKNSVEYLYLALMLRWERNAPPDSHSGWLDGEPARNTQITRMAYILDKIAAGQDGRVFGMLSRCSRRKDGRSYVSTDKYWMKEPTPLLGGWYFEGCTSLIQKQTILQHLTEVDISAFLVSCIDDFVAGKSIKRFVPSDEEEDEILRRSIDQEDPEDRVHFA